VSRPPRARAKVFDAALKIVRGRIEAWLDTREPGIARSISRPAWTHRS